MPLHAWASPGYDVTFQVSENEQLFPMRFERLGVSDEAVRKHLIEAKIFLTYQRQFNNLSIQEGRLRRQREKDTAALRQLQENRKRQAQVRLDKAAREYILAVHEGRHDSFEPAELGFEFSLGQIELRAMDIKPDLFADYEGHLAEADAA